MTSIYRFVGPVLLTAALASGCYGSGASTYTGGSGGTTGTSGTSTSAGGTSTVAGGTTTVAGGTTTVAGGTTTVAGGTTSRGGTTAVAGGTTTVAGGTTSAGGTTTVAGGTTSAGGTPTVAGGTTTGSGGAAGASGGTTARSGGTTTAGGTTSAGGAAGAVGGAAGAGTTPGWATPVTGGPSGTGTTATVTVNPSSTVGTIGPEFAGFSYEKTHVTNGTFTSNNASMIALYKLLGTPMMRLAANDVDVCSWGGTGTAPAQPSGQPFTHTILTGHVDQLCGFLAATGSKIIYGVNFKLGNVTASAAEAAYVMGKCASGIEAIEIGNEIDKYGSWSAQTTQYESFATAILAAPGALIAGPGSTGGSYSSFSAPFAASETAKFGTKLTLLTQHYYVAGSGSSSATASNLQAVASNFVSLCTTMNTAATTNKTPNAYRLGEMNTFSGHGQQGVSDTLISGLWAIDIMFTIAKNGGSGVNFHNGETGMDGTKPFYYSAIKETNGVVVEVEPEYYGMLLFTQAGTGPMVSTTVTPSVQFFTAYAVKANGFVGVVLNNKDATNGVNATVNLGAAVSSASAIYFQGTPAGSLSAPATSVTIAGAPITAAGVWNRNPPYIQATSGSTVSVYVPPASAALVRVLQ